MSKVVIDNPKTARHHADDLTGLRIELDAAPDYAAITSETPLPIAVAQHDAARAVRILIGLRQPAAEAPEECRASAAHRR